MESFNTIFSQVVEIHKVIKQLIDDTEKVCASERRLLKPWKKKKFKQDEVLNNQGNEAELPGKEKQNIPEVMLVEKAIAQAEKTRSRYIEKNQKKTVPKSIMVAERSSKGNSKLSLDQSTVAEKSGVICESKLQSLLPDGLHQSLAKVQKADIINKPLLHPEPSKPTKGTSQERIIVHTTSRAVRPVTHPTQSRASNADRKYKPAHASAPFQTTTMTKKIKPGQTRSQILRQNANNKLNSNTTVCSGGGKSIQPVKTKSSTVVSTEKRHAVERENETLKQNSMFSPATSQHQLFPSNRCTEVADKSCLSQIDDLNLNNNAGDNEEKTDQDSKERIEEEFLLSINGKNLSLPSKFSKLMSNNRRMREKLKLQSITRKAQEETSAADMFLSRLNNSISDDISSGKKQSLLSVHKLQDTYHKLGIIFKEICSLPIGEFSSWRDLLFAKRKLEYVLSSFAAAEEDFQKLYFGQATNKVLPSFTNKRHGLLWLPKNLQQENLALSSKMKYGQRKQLDSYMTFIHCIQTLLWENYIMEAVSKELMPLLKNSVLENPSERNCVELYRYTYSLLCWNGSSFPVMVQDQEESEHSVEEEF